MKYRNKLSIYIFFLSEVSEAILQNLRSPSESDQGVTGGTLVKLLALGKDTQIERCTVLFAVFRIRIHRIHKYLYLPDPDPKNEQKNIYLQTLISIKVWHQNNLLSLNTDVNVPTLRNRQKA